LIGNGIGMALALELHRELDMKTRITPIEREMRRRLFWTCYLMDRFASSGSKRPSLISDKSILLRLPSWTPTPNSLPIEGEFFQSGSNLHSLSSTSKKSQGSSGMLLDIVRILGITNRYLAAGGVKGDSHFPWHSLSNLSKIRQDLDIWASGTSDVFSSLETLFNAPDSTVLVLSKLIYHVVHCLIYRPFLPVDLAELAGTGQHQSWQIEATNLCFMHANAIAELVELGKQSLSIEWPAFVGYCICTAGTVHVHGAHYKGGREGEVFLASADFLSREMQQLSELRYAWASVQHQRETLQTIYGSHGELVKTMGGRRGRYSPVFHLEDFFDRYVTLGQVINGGYLSFVDVNREGGMETFTGHGLYLSRAAPEPANGLKRKASSSSGRDGTSDHEPRTSPTQAQAPQHLPQPTLSETPQIELVPQPYALPFSPSYTFNPHDSYDPMFGMPQQNYGVTDPHMQHQSQQQILLDGSGTVMTPGAGSNSGSVGVGEEKDPFLSLLEQLAENEHSRGGPSELDFFLSGGTG
jgi:hypothetical protein